MLETQISQVAQQVATSSQTSGIFPSQTETNPTGHVSAITLRDGKQLEDPVVKVKNNEGEIGSDEPQTEKAIGENEKLKVRKTTRKGVELCFWKLLLLHSR